MKLILLGAPGSGKGTVSEYIIKKNNIIHLSTGNLFRKRIEEKGQYWEDLKDCVVNGKLVSDDLVNKIVKSELEKYTNNESFILDGYPRTIEQADFLATVTNVDCVIYLNVPQDTLNKRLLGRRMCDKCKKIYNIYFTKTKVEGKCDIDNGNLIQRKDDNEEVIKDRIATYNINTFPLVDYYKKKNLLIDVDCSKSHDEIDKEIDKIIDMYSK